VPDAQPDDYAVYISPTLWDRGTWHWTDLAGPVSSVLLMHGWDGRTVARIANRLSASGPVQARDIATEFADVYVGYRPGDRLTLAEAERRDRAQQ
jgi:hypothetical protein